MWQIFIYLTMQVSLRRCDISNWQVSFSLILCRHRREDVLFIIQIFLIRIGRNMTHIQVVTVCSLEDNRSMKKCGRISSYFVIWAKWISSIFRRTRNDCIHTYMQKVGFRFFAIHYKQSNSPDDTAKAPSWCSCCCSFIWNGLKTRLQIENRFFFFV